MGLCDDCNNKEGLYCLNTIERNGSQKLISDQQVACGIKNTSEMIDLSSPPETTILEQLRIELDEHDDLLDAVINIKDNPPAIPRLDQIEAKINELIDWANSFVPPMSPDPPIEKLPE